MLLEQAPSWSIASSRMGGLESFRWPQVGDGRSGRVAQASMAALQTPRRSGTLPCKAVKGRQDAPWTRSVDFGIKRKEVASKSWASSKWLLVCYN